MIELINYKGDLPGTYCVLLYCGIVFVSTEFIWTLKVYYIY
jgi:hypothetical protein